MEEIIFWLEELTKPNTAEQTMITLTIVSIIIASIGVIVSGVAIFYAIQVPKKIAERQNKIALFEKRYEVYLIIQQLLSLSDGHQLRCDFSNESVRNRIYSNILFPYSENGINIHYEYTNLTTEKILNYLLIKEEQINNVAELLFDDFDLELCKNMCQNLMFFITMLLYFDEKENGDCQAELDKAMKECENYAKEYMNSCEKFKNNELIKLKKQLKL